MTNDKGNKDNNYQDFQYGANDGNFGDQANEGGNKYQKFTGGFGREFFKYQSKAQRRKEQKDKKGEGRANKDKKEKEEKLKEAIKLAIDRGVYEFKQKNPGLSSNDAYLQRHINPYAVPDRIGQLKEKYERAALDPEKSKKLLRDITRFVSSGGMLTKGVKASAKTGSPDDEKQYLSLPKRVIGSVFGRRAKGEKYLHETLDSFEELSGIFGAGDHGEGTADLTKYLESFRTFKPINDSLEALNRTGMIGPRKYRRWKRRLLKNAEKGRKAVPKTIKAYFEQALQKQEELKNPRATQMEPEPQGGLEDMIGQAAAILSFFGFGLVLATSPRMTGNAIKVSELFSSTGSLIGAGIFVAGLVLMLLTRKRKIKRIKRVKRKYK